MLSRGTAVPPLVPSHEAAGMDSGGSAGDWGGMWRQSLIGQCETYSPHGCPDGLSGNGPAPGWSMGTVVDTGKSRSQVKLRKLLEPTPSQGFPGEVFQNELDIAAWEARCAR